jgi:hypothetical protein
MRRLLVAVFILLILAVAADRLAWLLAEREVGARIQSSEGLSQRPDVSIGGFPFLTQVVRGQYASVRADLEDLTVEQGLTIDQARVHLTDLRVPLQSLIERSLDSVPVRGATVTGTISYASLDAVAASKIPGDELAITFGQGSSDAASQVAFTGTYANGAVSLKVSGDATVTADGGQLVISVVPDSLGLPRLVRAEVVRLLGISYRVPPLPLGLTVSRVAVSAGGVAVTATGSNLVLGSAGT